MRVVFIEHGNVVQGPVQSRFLYHCTTVVADHFDRFIGSTTGSILSFLARAVRF